jgi:uncharacterized protein (UPF0262 family)
VDFRLSAITLDERSVVQRSRAVEQEREVAIYDLLEANLFKPDGSPGGPYHLTLGVEETRLALDIALEDGTPHGKVLLSLMPLRKTVKDYFLVCESYYKAIRAAPLQARLEGKVETDFDTARRLFTLVCVLQMRG